MTDVSKVAKAMKTAFSHQELLERAKRVEQSAIRLGLDLKELLLKPWLWPDAIIAKMEELEVQNRALQNTIVRNESILVTNTKVIDVQSKVGVELLSCLGEASQHIEMCEENQVILFRINEIIARCGGEV